MPNECLVFTVVAVHIAISLYCEEAEKSSKVWLKQPQIHVTKTARDLHNT